jgi:hypothetical protein
MRNEIRTSSRGIFFGEKAMKDKVFLFPIMLLAMLAFAIPAAAQENLTAYVVHGIDGDDFGLDPELPVDVWISGLGCALPDFRFADRVGPLAIPAGTYDITISLADAVMPCEGAGVISLAGVTLPAGANATIIAHRTADGSPGTGDLLGLGVTASIFNNDFTTTGRGKGRIIAQHTALAPAVDVVVSRDYEDPGAPGVTVAGFSNPTAEGDALLSQINAEFRPGEWDVVLEVDGAAVFGPDTILLEPYKALYIYAVGDFFIGTFQYLVYTEDGLKPESRPRERERGQFRQNKKNMKFSNLSKGRLF